MRLKNVVFKRELSIEEVLKLVEEVMGEPHGKLRETEIKVRLAGYLSSIAGETKSYNKIMTDHAGLWFIYGVIVASTHPELIQLVKDN